MMMMILIRGRDEWTKFIMRIKEQDSRLNFQEIDDDDDDGDNQRKRWRDQLHLVDQGTVNKPTPSGK